MIEKHGIEYVREKQREKMRKLRGEKNEKNNIVKNEII
jgi:hypothetical protein